MNTDPSKILELWHYAEGLKLEERALYLSNGRPESVADHSWRLSFMLMMITPRISINIDFERAIKITIAHDILEIEAGDISSIQHFGNKEVTEKKIAGEKEAAESIRNKFGDMGKEIVDLWQEYEDQETDEAKVIKALDKLDARVQAIDDNNMATFPAESKATVQEFTKNTEKLCSIDDLLKDLDKLSLKERQEKWGF